MKPRCGNFPEFIQISPRLVRSTVWRQPDHVRVVFVTLLLMADWKGIVQASDAEIADHAQVNPGLCRDALWLLQQPDQYCGTTTGRYLLSGEDCYEVCDFPTQYLGRSTPRYTPAQAAYRRFLRTKFWRDLSARKIAAVGMCEECGSKINLQAHHRLYRSDWFQTRLSDLICLCRDCHETAHFGV